VLDPAGRLYQLEARPNPTSPPGTPSWANWPLLLDAAGFDPARLRSAPPRLVPPVYADRRSAWEGTYPGSPGQAGLPIHIEAASFGGAPVWFTITGPWSRYSTKPEPRPETIQELWYAVQIAVVFFTLWLAPRNLRLGRADKRSALRLTVFVASLELFYELLMERHLLLRPLASVAEKLTHGLSTALVLWMFYIAFEPSVRRLWPERIVSWNRLLAGQFRDPLVGRDLLIGCLLGLAAAISGYGGELATGRFAAGTGGMTWPDLETVHSGLQVPAQHLIFEVLSSLFVSMEFMVLLLGLRLLARREKLAIGMTWIPLTVAFLGSGPRSGLQLALSALGAGLLVLAWTRLGLLVGAVCYLTRHLCLKYPMTLDPSAWYAGSTLFAVLVILGLSFYGFSLAVAGRPWFAGRDLLDD